MDFAVLSKKKGKEMKGEVVERVEPHIGLPQCSTKPMTLSKFLCLLLCPIKKGELITCYIYIIKHVYKVKTIREIIFINIHFFF